MPDDVSPLSFDEAVRAYTQNDRQAEPSEDNRPDPESAGPDEAQEDDEDELVQGLADEDEDNLEGEQAEGTPEDAEEEPEEPESAKGRFLPDDGKVRLSDGTVTTLRELKQGNLLQSDYSKKTLALAEERKADEQKRAQFAAVEQALAQDRETFALIIRNNLPQPPDPSMMEQGSGNYDPFRYMAEKEAYERKTRDIQQVINQHQQMLARQAQEAEAERQKSRDKEAERLFEVMPELKKPGAYNAFWGEAVEYVAAKGFTAEELNDVDDHRTYTVLADAIAYHRLKAKLHNAREKVNGKPPMQGSARRSTDAVRKQEANQAFARLNKTGSLKDGIQALLAREKVR